MKAALIAFALLAIAAPSTNAGGRHLLQNAGTGAGCDSAVTEFDNASGYGVEGVEEGVAKDITATKGRRRLRQNAGTGAACNSILTEFDNASGYGTEGVEDKIATDLGGHPQPGAGTGRKLSAAETGRDLLQTDKIARGDQAISQAAGTGSYTQGLNNILIAADGDSTGDLAMTGKEIGQAEDDTIGQAGTLVPGRKLQTLPGTTGRDLLQTDKIARGDQAISEAVGTGSYTQGLNNILIAADGDSTGDLAEAGKEVGQAEDDTVGQAGTVMPGK